MFADEPIQYLAAFREFLLEQQSKTDDPALGALIAEINRELTRRHPTAQGNSHDSATSLSLANGGRRIH